MDLVHDAVNSRGRMAVRDADGADGLEFRLKVLRGAEVVGAGNEGADDGVLGGGCGAGVVAGIEVGVGGFAVDGGGLIGMDEDVKEGKVAV